MILDCVHFFCLIFFSCYGFLFSKNWFDPYYIFINLITVLSNTMLKGECIIALIHKWKDSTYKVGTTLDSPDLLNIFGKKYHNHMVVINEVSKFLKAASTYIVLKRMNYRYSLEASLVFLFYLVFLNSYYLYNGIFFLLFLIIIINVFNLKR